MDFIFSNPNFQNYTMKNGISSNFCYKVLQDKKGFIWLATLDGLNRFDGNNWNKFQQQSENKSHKLISNWVVDLDLNEEGNVYINSTKGISTFNQSTKSIKTFSKPIKGWGKILCLKDFVFVSSWTGIEMYKKKENKLILEKQFLETANNSINCLFKDEQENIWACPEDNPSLIKINLKTLKLTYLRKLKIDGVDQEVIVNSISQFSKDTILLNSRYLGLIKFCTKNKLGFSFLKKELNTKNISCSILYKFQNNSFLILGTKTDGLFAVHLNNKKVFSYVFLRV